MFAMRLPPRSIFFAEDTARDCRIASACASAANSSRHFGSPGTPKKRQQFPRYNVQGRLALTRRPQHTHRSEFLPADPWRVAPQQSPNNVATIPRRQTCLSISVSHRPGAVQLGVAETRPMNVTAACALACRRGARSGDRERRRHGCRSGSSRTCRSLHAFHRRVRRGFRSPA